MIPIRSLLIRVVTIVGLVLLTVAVPVAAEDDAFKRGLGLLDGSKSNPRAAADAFREAIKEDGKEGRRMVGRTLGFGGNPYLPYYFLGEALMKAGDCAGAVAAWVTSEQQQVILGFRDQLSNLRKWSIECAAKGVLLEREFAQAQATTIQAVSTAGDYLVRVRQAIDANLGVWQTHPELAPQYNEASAQYEAARKGLDTARVSRLLRDFTDAQAAAGRTNTALTRLEASLRTAAEAADLVRRRTQDVEDAIAGAVKEFEALGAALSPALAKDRQSAGDVINRSKERLAAGRKTQNMTVLDDARTLALTATATLGRIRDQVRQLEIESAKRRVEQAIGAASQTFELFDRSMARLEELTAQRAASVASNVLSERDALRKQRVAARRRFDAARESGNADAVAKAAVGLEALRLRLNALLEGFGPLTLRDRGVPAVIEDGLRLFLEGEHQKVLDLLSAGAIDSNVPLSAHAFLLRAGSLYTLFVRSGEKDQMLLASARQDVERARAASPALRPDKRVFGQRFINFFQNAGASPPAR